MGSKELLKQALKLTPEERFTVVKGLLISLDEPDKKLDETYKLLYSIEEDHISVIAVAHQHRRPDYWIG